MHSHTPISEAVLKAAEGITLAELLESPTYSPWLISAFGNAPHETGGVRLVAQRDRRAHEHVVQ